MKVNSIEAYNYIERISNLLRNTLRQAGASRGLQPIHLEALAYLKVCNRYSDTPQALTDYLGLTKGTVSQTLKVLESKGLIRKTSDAKDGRKIHLTLPPKGKAVIKDFVPPTLFRDAYADLAPETQSQLTHHLKQLLRTMQEKNALKSFGVCRSCRFNQQTPSGNYFCKLTGETLSKQETRAICREHEYQEG